jgi:hypothetical protein
MDPITPFRMKTQYTCCKKGHLILS